MTVPDEEPADLAARRETSTPVHTPIDTWNGVSDPRRQTRGSRSVTSATWPGRQQARKRERFLDRVEVWISRLSNKNNFWRRVCSLIWLPYAFRSGIRVKRLTERTFTAVLPFRRFNRNWYNAMAGAALLANSEIAGGTYIFGACDGRRRVVCKKLTYTFLRPCLGPAIYEVIPEEDIAVLLTTGDAFNINVRIEIRQQLGKPGAEKRVGRSFATFHVTPVSDRHERQARKAKHRSRARARAARHSAM